jgi:hypothetical protein
MTRAFVATLLAFGIAGTAALAPSFAPSFAQGVAPGGPIGGSTGIGSGLGAVPGGTGPSYPNGTGAGPPPPAALPPGGYPPVGRLDSASPSTATPSAPATAAPSRYPQPQEPFAASPPQPLLKLPQDAASPAAFMDGCWRTDLFRPSSSSQQGVVTYCFDGNGVGRLLFRRLEQSSYSCSGPAAVRYEGQQLHITTPDTSCTDGGHDFPATLDCVKAADRTAQCGSEASTIHLHFVGARRTTSTR